MSNLAELLGNPERCGIVRYAGPLDDIERHAKAAGLAVYRINLSGARGKKGWLDAVAEELKFPSYFGDNWDALHECLRDLHWIDAPGWVFIIVNGASFIKKNPRAWKTALAVMRSAAEYWRAAGKPFWVVLVDDDKDAFPGLPVLGELLGESRQN